MDNMLLQAEELEALESIYGEEWKKDTISDNSYSIRITGDVELFLTLDTLYPSEAPPTYQLMAPGLSKTVKLLISSACEEIYLENIGSPVLFQWIEKIKEIVESNIESNKSNATETAPIVNVKKAEDYSRYNVIHGEVIQDRKSTFQGHVCEVHNENDVRNVMNFLMQNKKISQATHNMLAYRIQKPNGVLLQDCDDDGENLAGGRLLHLLQIVNVKNVMVVVSRWYGGIQLGADRFKHINNAARTVLQDGGFIK
ncbi:PREDICTED: protein IMPACT-like [Nicrophorus vespilloides]|uniref:Protein IMPACT-like n=1 Tax=Nicrophorus vespilloides TaxID=110193 RepID=A0ABM1M3E5_NICVS|nr:PREDICTED: protein IMPACT-like [Nicrophorus vespilloides]